MPWTHCDKQLEDDLGTCPTCGISKADWTVHLERTKVLRLGIPKPSKKARDGWVEVAVEDEDGTAVVGTLEGVVHGSDGRRRKGSLEQGVLRVVDLAEGTCLVQLDQALEPTDPLPRGPDPGTHETALRQRHRFVLKERAWLAVRVLRAGRPWAGVKARFDGQAAATADAQGVAFVPVPVRAGRYTLRLPHQAPLAVPTVQDPTRPVVVELTRRPAVDVLSQGRFASDAEHDDHDGHAWLAVRVLRHGRPWAAVKATLGLDGDPDHALEADAQGLLRLEDPVDPGRYELRLPHQAPLLVPTVADPDRPVVVDLAARPAVDVLAQGRFASDAEGDDHEGHAWVAVRVLRHGRPWGRVKAALALDGDPDHTLEADAQGLLRLEDPVDPGRYELRLPHQAPLVVPTVADPTRPVVVDVAARPAVDVLSQGRFASDAEHDDHDGHAWLAVRVLRHGRPWGGVEATLALDGDPDHALAADAQGLLRLEDSVDPGRYELRLPHQAPLLVPTVADPTRPVVVDVAARPAVDVLSQGRFASDAEVDLTPEIDDEPELPEEEEP